MQQRGAQRCVRARVAQAKTDELGFELMRDGIKKASADTILTPRFYTTGVAVFERTQARSGAGAGHAGTARRVQIWRVLTCTAQLSRARVTRDWRRVGRQISACLRVPPAQSAPCVTAVALQSPQSKGQSRAEQACAKRRVPRSLRFVALLCARPARTCADFEKMAELVDPKNIPQAQQDELAAYLQVRVAAVDVVVAESVRPRGGGGPAGSGRAGGLRVVPHSGGVCALPGRLPTVSARPWAVPCAAPPQEMRNDYNQRHFVRNTSFQEAADKLSGPTRKIFIEFL